MDNRVVKPLTKSLFARLKALMILVCLVVAGSQLATVAFAQEDLPLKRDRTLQELQELRAAISISEQRRQDLIEEISGLDKDRVSINRSLIETSKKSRAIEKRVSKATKRLSQLREEQDEVREFLGKKKALLAEVLAALQRMGRKPPPALLVSPEDALSSVRSAILLGSVVPEVRSETRILLGQLQDLVRISTEIETQRNMLSTDLANLANEEERLNLLMEEKRKLSGIAQTRLVEEQAKSAELAASATSLNELINNLETQIGSVREAEEAARIAEAERKAREANRDVAAGKFKTEEAFADLSRTAPAIAFDGAKGLLPLPVNGDLASAFGEDDEFGDPVDGLSLQARENARVISPADGWIVYAGPFRTYGQLLIINAGNGYHVVMAGLEKINVSPGQFVLVGEPIGQMGARRIASAGAVELNTTKPILYVEFRKDGKPIDPSPWWADTNIQRATNGS
ncbi:MAG: peptidoglycan DD-metalloendopeptidase family protein [Pseudomonadota bacterium]